MSLIFLTSPAKTLNESKNWQGKGINTSLPRNIEMVNHLANVLKKLSKNDLQKSLKVSDKIAELNFNRFKSFTKKHDINNSKPAILLYDGAVYKQIDSDNFGKTQQTYAQNHIRIISGFYGLLRPYDLIQPYRLEMNNKVKVNDPSSLVKYWQDELTNLLNQDIKETKATAVINLASKEYSQTVDKKKLSVLFISIDFKQKRDNKLKTIAIHAKQARGAMIEYAIKNNIRDINSLLKANINGFTFSKKEGDHYIFVR